MTLRPANQRWMPGDSLARGRRVLETEVAAVVALQSPPR